MRDNPLVKRLLSVNCPLVVFWFPWYWRKSEISDLRIHAGLFLWSSRKGVGGKLVLLGKTLIWPLIAVSGLIIGWLLYSGDALRMVNRSRLSQLTDLVYLTFWWGFPPQEYYLGRLYFHKLTDVLKHFLSDKEIALLNLAISRGRDTIRINNKLRFDKICRNLDLPVIPVVCAYSGGQEVEVEEGFSLPGLSFYFKPVDGLCGQGIERWDYDATTTSWDSSGRKLDEVGLRAYLKEAAQKETFILQEAAVNHSEIVQFSTGGLITFRVVTVVRDNSDIEILSTDMVMPFGAAAANHGSHGGILSRLDARSATLGIAYKRLPVLMKHTHHPETGAKIEGVKLTVWPQLESLAIRAHKCFPDIFSIGWDLAVTPNGPVIVEANTQYGAPLGFFPGRTAYRFYKDFDNKACGI